MLANLGQTNILPPRAESVTIPLDLDIDLWRKMYIEDLENELRALQTRINFIRARLGKYQHCECGREVK